MNLLAICVALLGSEILDHEMDASEKKKTGIYKLSDKEKASLQNWIDAHYQKRSEPLPLSDQDKHALLQENLRSGQYIRLSDNTLWEIHPQDMAISQGWITPVNILVTQSGQNDYPYKLTNSLTGSSLRARKADSLPPAPSQIVPKAKNT